MRQLFSPEVIDVETLVTPPIIKLQLSRRAKEVPKLFLERSAPCIDSYVSGCRLVGGV